MRVARLQLHNFRGWASFDLQPDGYVLLAGVPRAGRTDIIAALVRLLDPSSLRLQPSLLDIRQWRATSAPTSGDGAQVASPSEDQGSTEPIDEALVTGSATNHQDDSPVAGASIPYTSDYAEVEATLVDLDPEFEQLCDGYLEPLDASGQVDLSGTAAPDASLGVRFAYRVSYDSVADVLDHVVYFPARSQPDAAQYHRVPASVRRALPVFVLNSARPLQLRAEGALRRLVTDRGADEAATAFRNVEQGVSEATSRLSADATVAAAVDAVLQVDGIARRLGDAEVTSADVQFRPDDGSLSGLLRAVQPALDLDGAGLLTLASHGSTTSAVLTAAESLLLTATTPGAVVLGDDVGDGLDAATAEHLTAVLRGRAEQVWLTTRRPEVARAFDPAEIVRLTRHGGTRAHHVLAAPGDRKEIAVRRLLQAQLLPALTAPCIAITEGPHDLTTYSSADRRRSPAALPLSAHGVRLISADNGSGGGTSQIPRVAGLAHGMGFRVIALIDCDPEKTSAAILGQIQSACDAVVRLPAGMALEGALVAGVEVSSLRAAATVLPEYGLRDPMLGKSDAAAISAITQLLHKKGVHEQYLEVLIAEHGTLPPVLTAALDAVALAAELGYSGPSLIDLPAPAGAAGS